MKKVETQIRHFRTLKGLKQSELASMLGKSEGVISNWEKGINSPNIECVARMLDIFEVDANTFFGWESESDGETTYSNEALQVAAAYDQAPDNVRRGIRAMLEPFMMVELAADMKLPYFDYTAEQVNEIHRMAREQNEIVKKVGTESLAYSSTKLGVG